MIIILSGHFQGCRSTPTTLDSSLLLGDKPSTQRHTSKLLCKYGTQERNVDTMSTLAQIIAIPWIFLFISFSLRALATEHLSWTSLCLLQQQRAKLSPRQQQTGGAHVSPGVTWSVETATGLRGVTPRWVSRVVAMPTWQLLFLGPALFGKQESPFFDDWLVRLTILCDWCWFRSCSVYAEKYCWCYSIEI